MKPCALLLLWMCISSAAYAQKIYTFAGNGQVGFGGDGGAATDSRLNFPQSMVFDANGNMYFADARNNRIRKIDRNGIITTVAGNGTTTYTNGPALNTGFNLPDALAIDSHGDIYISDSFNNCIRKLIVATGIVSTYAGIGIADHTGDGGPAISATLNWPRGICFDLADNLYIADNNNYVVRKVTPGGIITTIAGLNFPGFSGDGAPAVNAALFFPSGVTVDASGNVYIADNTNNRVRKIDSVTGIISTIAGNGIATPANDDGGPATSATLTPTGLAIDNDGNIYVADELHHMVRRVDAATGIITTIAGNNTSGTSGNGVPAASAPLNGPVGIAIGMNNSIFIAEAGNNRLSVVPRPLDQTITFAPITDKHVGDAPFTVSASSSSGLPVELGVDDPGKATLSGNQVTIAAPGRPVITAKQPGSIFFNPAPDVARSFCIIPVKPELTSEALIRNDTIFACPWMPIALRAPEGMDVYSWSDNTSLSSVVVIPGNSYSVTLSAGTGCPAVTSDIIRSVAIECELTFYQGISPNGDGKNEVFVIEGITTAPDASDNQVFIYNRWGDEVWRGTNYNNDDVSFRGIGNDGQGLLSGVYYYKVVFQRRATKTGFLSLMK